jgi:hypothetical protein
LFVDKDPVDGDPDRGHAWTLAEIQRTPEGVPGPATIVVDTGNGAQGLWRLREPIAVDGDEAKIADYERRNYGLEIAFAADECRNVDRVLRLPGTINWPNRTKRQRGRVPTLARLVEIDLGRVYDIEEFTARDLPATLSARRVSASRAQTSRPQTSGAAAERVSRESLAHLVADRRIYRLIVDGTPADADQSAALWRACCALIRLGIADETIHAIVTDPRNGIAKHALAQLDANRAAWRAIDRAYDAAWRRS